MFATVVNGRRSTFVIRTLREIQNVVMFEIKQYTALSHQKYIVGTDIAGKKLNGIGVNCRPRLLLLSGL